MMVILSVAALVCGVLAGTLDVLPGALDFLSEHAGAVLYVLMFSVGISVGLHRGLLQELRRHHVKILIIPLGITAASALGGVVCALITRMPLGLGAAITSGMGWYSLAGVTIGNLAGAQAGSIAFLGNLMWEIISFFLIPPLAARFNSYTCIAPAGDTSEDTTLPMMIRYTNEETVVLSVLNGMICSALVPVLISLFCSL